MHLRVFAVLVVAVAVVSASPLEEEEAPRSRARRSVSQPVFRDCGNRRSVIRFKELRFSPDPIIVPGKLTLTFKAENRRPMRNMDVDVAMVRKMSLAGWTWDMSIPCVMEVGSCRYTDLCQKMIDWREQEDTYPILRKLREGMEAAGAPTSCPVPRFNLTIENLELDLPEIPTVVSGLADGTYEITYRVLDHRRPWVELGCLKVQATVSTQQPEEEEPIKLGGERDDEDAEQEADCDGWLWC